jgi:hypothetical protein
MSEVLEDQDIATKKVNANTFTQVFIKDFFNRFGIYPEVRYTFDHNSLKRLSLGTILEDIQKIADKDTALEGLERDLSSKCRKSRLVAYRYIYFKIAHDMGYSLESIGALVDRDHSTVIHGLRCIESRIEVGDKPAKALLMLVMNDLETKYGTGATIYRFGQIPVDTGSAVSAVQS